MYRTVLWADLMPGCVLLLLLAQAMDPTGNGRVKYSLAEYFLIFKVLERHGLPGLVQGATFEGQGFHPSRTTQELRAMWDSIKDEELRRVVAKQHKNTKWSEADLRALFKALEEGM